jgi:hypothetical protein
MTVSPSQTMAGAPKAEYYEDPGNCRIAPASPKALLCEPATPVPRRSIRMRSRNGSEPLAGPEYEREAILTADLDLRDIARSRLDFDVMGHYARPDIFELRLDDESPRRSVTSVRLHDKHPCRGVEVSSPNGHVDEGEHTSER